MEQQQFFKGLRVVELASVLAGPAVGMFFSELGAEVIKIENPHTGGDVTRSWKLATEDPNSPVSAYFSSVNYQKEHRFWDLRDEASFQKLQTLLAETDVLIVNFKPGDADKLSLTYEDVKALQPKLIYGEINGYGSESKRTAYDVVLQAESGLMSINGNADSGPLKLPVAFIDLFAAHQLKEGILLALLQKEKHGKGAKVSVSLFDSALAALANQATNWLMNKHLPQRIGSLHPNIAPYGETYRCKDDKTVILAIGSNRQFVGLCDLLKVPHLATSTDFLNNPDRLANRKKLQSLLEPIFRRLESDWLLAKALSLNIPIGLIRNLKEVFELDEAQALLLKSEMEGRETIRVKGNVFKIRS